MKSKILSEMKNKISPEGKIKLHEQGAEDPRKTTSWSEESGSEYELEFAPNQLLHLHQTVSYTQEKWHKDPILRHTQNQTQ